MTYLLSQKYPLETLKTLLIPKENWHPYPTIHERDAWEALPATVRAAYIAEGEAVMNTDWAHLLAVRYLDFARDGNRSRYEHDYFERRRRLIALTLAECVEGRGRFLDDIVNGIWLICEESAWWTPCHMYMQQVEPGLPDTTEPVVDLFASETAAILAWGDYLLGDTLDTISPLVRPRVHREIDARVLTPCLEREDFWWMGFTDHPVNNWNPWINANGLTSALLIEPESDRRATLVAKSMASLDRFTGPYPTDGGCDEGPNYWSRAGASLLDCLELLYSASGGKMDIYDEPLIQNIGRFIYRVHISDDYFVNFADAPALVAPPAWAVFRYGQRIRDPKMMALGAWAADRQDVRCERKATAGIEHLASPGRLIPTLFSLDDLSSVPPVSPLPRDVWLDQIQVMVARDQVGSSAGFYVAAKGGHNAESHNHNDVGNVIVYVDGKPVIIDAGVETYTRKTFSAQRYDIWTMQSAYHTLPTVVRDNVAVMQAPGKQFAARDAVYTMNDTSAQLNLDIAGAYPDDAKLTTWRRTVTLHREQGVDIVDAYDLAAPAGEITLSVLTPCAVDAGTPGKITLTESALPDGRSSGVAMLHYEADKVRAVVEEIVIEDPQIGRAWGERLFRILFTAQNPQQQDTWTLKVSR